MFYIVPVPKRLTLFLLLIRSSTCNILIYKVHSLLNMILDWIPKLEANFDVLAS